MSFARPSLPAFEDRRHFIGLMLYRELVSSAIAHHAMLAAADGGLEQIEQHRIIRDIVGNPLRPVTVERSWLAWNNATVLLLAQSIYDDRAFERLPILADALEDAGCHDEDILEHCRGGGAHPRGCWVVDLLLGKE